MLGENYNQKNTVMDHSKNSQKDTNNLPANYQTQGLHKLSYNKTNKLVTALYMVTDIMDKEEPLRNKLRNLGTEIISDTSYINILSDINTDKLAILEVRINETLSFLEVAKAINLISEMNCNILKKEFSNFTESILDFKTKINNKEEKNPEWLADFLEEEIPLLDKEGVGGGNYNHHLATRALLLKKEEKKNIPIGHQKPTRLGLQKGSTLLQALSEVGEIKNASKVSNRNSNDYHGHLSNQNERSHFGFDVLKKQRREEIIKIIKACSSSGEDKEVYPEGIRGATIKDIKDSAVGVLVSCGEKTLQRELFSMVSDGVLNRTGEKRWSRYSLR